MEYVTRHLLLHWPAEKVCGSTDPETACDGEIRGIYSLSMGVRCVIGSLILLTCLSRTLSVQTTNAAEATNAEVLLDQGFTDYRDGDYKAAVVSLEKVALLQPT